MVGIKNNYSIKLNEYKYILDIQINKEYSNIVLVWHLTRKTNGESLK